MKCVMCPRNNIYERKMLWIEDEIFEKVVDGNIKPYSDEDLNNFWEWLDNNTKLTRNER